LAYATSATAKTTITTRTISTTLVVAVLLMGQGYARSPQYFRRSLRQSQWSTCGADGGIDLGWRASW
jgi:hypothetical protein